MLQCFNIVLLVYNTDLWSVSTGGYSDCDVCYSVTTLYCWSTTLNCGLAMLTGGGVVIVACVAVLQHCTAGVQH